MGGKIKQQDKSGFRKRCEHWQHCHGNGGPASACCSLAQAPWAPWHTVIQDGEGWCHGETVLFLLEVSRGHRRCSGSWWQGEREAAVGHKSLLGRIQPPVPPLCPPHQQLPAWLLLDGAHRPWGRLVMLLDSRDSPLGKKHRGLGCVGIPPRGETWNLCMFLIPTKHIQGPAPSPGPTPTAFLLVTAAPEHPNPLFPAACLPGFTWKAQKALSQRGHRSAPIPALLVAVARVWLPPSSQGFQPAPAPDCRAVGPAGRGTAGMGPLGQRQRGGDVFGWGCR